MELKQNLKEKLEDRILACRSVAERYERATATLLLVAVVASAAATIAVGTGSLTKEINATLAAIPGLVATVFNTFKFEARARWWRKKQSKFQEAASALEWQGAAEKDISQELSKFLIEHENDWPSFGKPPSGIPI